jgi:hypothetical protein
MIPLRLHGMFLTDKGSPGGPRPAQQLIGHALRSSPSCPRCPRSRRSLAELLPLTRRSSYLQMPLSLSGVPREPLPHPSLHGVITLRSSRNTTLLGKPHGLLCQSRHTGRETDCWARDASIKATADTHHSVDPSQESLHPIPRAPGFCYAKAERRTSGGRLATAAEKPTLRIGQAATR